MAKFLTDDEMGQSEAQAPAAPKAKKVISDDEMLSFSK